MRRYVEFILHFRILVIGVTILRIGQLISVHLFVGFLLVGPVSLKLASTGYRFVRYYSGERTYRRKRPPESSPSRLAEVEPHPEAVCRDGHFVRCHLRERPSRTSLPAAGSRDSPR